MNKTVSAMAVPQQFAQKQSVVQNAYACAKGSRFLLGAHMQALHRPKEKKDRGISLTKKAT